MLLIPQILFVKCIRQNIVMNDLWSYMLTEIVQLRGEQVDKIMVSNCLVDLFLFTPRNFYIFDVVYGHQELYFLHGIINF
jgi:hypothetical protein